MEGTNHGTPGARIDGSSGGMLLAVCSLLPSVDFTADLPVVQVRRTVMRRALVSTAIPPRVALAMGEEPLLLRYTIGLFGYGPRFRKTTSRQSTDAAKQIPLDQGRWLWRAIRLSPVAGWPGWRRSCGATCG